ncbi:hypothetical protein J7U46_12555 [Pelomonas sp. V22]|uniref:M66 family metalloprotease n=1 Tax=Pelomonas sp. V22 TaxID=2822139 RepID=UPI0024A8CD04|nr:M66 family metalloprotease [Pelomonas sp. V22]MDI4633880.1 hypothetical protein [Pelomonas sp. V22]
MKFLDRLALTGATLALAGLLAACGGGGGGSSSPPSGGGTVPTASTPSIVVQPASVSAQRCETVRFTVSAEGTGPFSYQWQRNEVDIPGAQQATLQIASTSSADDQARFSVMVSNSAGQTRSATATLSVNTADEAKLSIASIELAQGMLMSSSDAMLELVQERELLVKVNARAPTPMTCKPASLLRIEDAAGVLLREIALTPPSLPIPSTTAATVSLQDSYSATVPAEFVKPGLRLVVSLPGQTPVQRLAPPVAPSPVITLVAIPLQVGASVAQIPTGMPDYIRARSPLQGLVQETRPTLRSTAVPTQPAARADWADAMSKLLTEVNTLRTLEGAPKTSYYFGFVRQDVPGSVVGLGYVPGGAAVGYDKPGDLAATLDSLQHELGHNFNLRHAPCGDPPGPDPLYPYANAQMGAGSRMVWGYDSVNKLFIDPGNSSNHDLMSYCSGTWFSDYSYYRAQQRLHTAQPSSMPSNLAARTVAQVAMAAPASQAGALLLITGEIGPQGLRLAAPWTYSGQADEPASGPYVLSLTLASGEQRRWRFDAPPLEHAPQIRHFHFSIAHPGAIAALSIAREGQVLHAQGDASAAGRRRAQQAAAAWPQLQAQLAEGRLSLQWDGQRWPLLSATQLGKDGKRRVLAQGLSGGQARIEISGEAQAFELSFSDGLNSQLLWLDGAGRPQAAPPPQAP